MNRSSCAASKYNLPTLQRLALRKQGLHTGIQCSTILSSARYAYANTPDTESKLRAHYLALIIRSRGTFKHSGTMQMEMERGGKMFFDLFVAMCNHMVSLVGSLCFSSCLADWFRMMCCRPGSRFVVLLCWRNRLVLLRPCFDILTLGLSHTHVLVLYTRIKLNLFSFRTCY